MRLTGTGKVWKLFAVMVCAGLLACSGAQACSGSHGWYWGHGCSWAYGCPGAHGWPWNQTEADKEYYFWQKLTERAAGKAWQIMHGKPLARNAIVLTNANFVMIDGHGAAACNDALQNATGATPGKGTLLNVHTSVGSNLYFFFYDKASGKAVYMEPDTSEVADVLSQLPGLRQGQIAWKVYTIPEDTLFSHIGNGVFKADTMFDTGGAVANEISTGREFNGREFSIMGIVLAVVHGAPTDVIQSILFHDHYCPGVTSGIMLARYLMRDYPAGSYFVYSMPPWCKDDALQIILNNTPGKKGYAVTYLTDADLARLDHGKPEYANIAGVFFRRVSGAYQGIVLAFDFDAAAQVAVGDYTAEFPSWQTKLKYDVELLKYMDTPEAFTSTLFTFTADRSPSEYARPGVDQLEAFGLLAPTP